MISASKFYSEWKRKVSSFRLLSQTKDYAENKQTWNIVILPPALSSNAADSETEEVPQDKLGEEDYLFEPAGEFKVQYEYSIGASCDSQDEEPLQPSKKKKERSKWRKSTEFINDISSTFPAPLADSHTELSRKSPFELWKIFFTEDLLKTIVVQTNLYANRDKNEDHFCVEKEELLNFLGVLLNLASHSLPGEQYYWSNQPDMEDSIVSKALIRKRFLTTKSKIHFVDNNTLDGSNKIEDRTILLHSECLLCKVWNVSWWAFNWRINGPILWTAQL